MVFPNFFYYLCKAQLSHIPPLHIPLSRETASPCTTLPPGTTLPSCTRAASRIKRTRLPHTLHLARLCHTRHTHAMHPRPHSTLALRATTPHKGYATRATHTLCILALTAHTPSVLPPPRKGLRHAALPPSMKATLLHAPTPPQVF